MTISTKGKRYTLADLEHVAQPWDDTRYEIIDGELHVSSQPSNRHQFSCTLLVVCLGTWDERSGLGVTLTAPGPPPAAAIGRAPTAQA